jgi:WD40 repeat protein
MNIMSFSPSLLPSLFMRLFWICALCALLSSVSPVSLGAQSISVLNLSTGNFPRLSAQFYALTAGGSLARGITAQNARVAENGVERRVVSVSCPTEPAPTPLSVTLTLDVSGSMSFARDGVTSNLAIMQSAARALINAMTLGQPSPALPGGSECAVTSFDHENYLNQDWTTDRARLLRAIDNLEPQGGTDYDAGFLLRPGGALEIVKTAKHKRVVVFMTDGVGGGSESEIIRVARLLDTRVYVVTLGFQAPLILRNIAEQTGGFALENIGTPEEARAAFLTILLAARDTPPCEIVWESEPPATECGVVGVFRRATTIGAPRSAFGEGQNPELVLRNTGYILPAPPQAQLIANPPSVGFTLNQAQVGMPQTRTLTLTALNADYRVSNIIASDTAFTVSPTQFTLASGASQTLTVQFTPQADGYAVANFLVVADTCSTGFFAVARTIVPPPRPTLVLTRPNGGERFLAGNDEPVLWSGISPDDSVRLEYSLDSGATWNLLAERAGGLAFDWRQIPNTPSDRCLMRATHVVASPDPDTVYRVTDIATQARFVLGGERVAAALDGQVTFWDSFVPAFYGGQARHANAIRSIDASPDGARLASADGAGTIVIWDVAGARLASAIIGNVGYAVRYSPDGKLLVAAGGSPPDNPNVVLLQFYDAQTTELLREIRYSAAFGRPRELFFSPDGRIIGMVRGDGGLAFWEVESGAIIPAPPGSSRDVNAGTFSPNGTELLLAKRTGVERWDWLRRTLLRRFAAGVNTVSARYSPDGKRIITTAFSAGASIWDAGGVNALIRTFTNVGEEATFAEFHPDSRRFLIVSNQTARVFALAEPYALQSDVSDSLWAIVAPLATARDIDMQTSIVGAPKDSVVRAFIRNVGSHPARLDSITFAGDCAAAFTLVAGAPATIEPGDSLAVEFRFRPLAAGECAASIIVSFAHGSLQYSIRGVGVAPTLEAIGEIIDFGDVLVGAARDTLVTAVLRNTGLSPIAVSMAQLGGPDNRQFSILSGANAPFALAPGQARALSLRFAPEAEGRANGSVVFTYDGGLRATARMIGAGVRSLPAPPCELRFAEIAARPNDTVCFSLTLPCPAEPIFSDSVTALVSVPASLLFPLAPTPAGVVAEGVRYIPITLYPRRESATSPTQRLDLRPLQNLCFSVMLGSTSSGAIGLEIIRPANAPVIGSNATFRLITSQAGGEHLFFSSPVSLQILSALPNPASDNLTLYYQTGANTGRITLSLLDIFGRMLRSSELPNAPSPGGVQETTFSVRDISPAGVYYIRLQAGRENSTKRILIRR